MYFYKCPGKNLAYLQIQIDEKGSVRSCIFSDTKGSYTSESPEKIKFALDAYFQKGKNIPQQLVSKNVQGTTFQKKVWSVIHEIPFGKTITYSQIAHAIGSDQAVRAVGTACGKNPLALFIPCHRVIRKTGEDYHYSWGPERKKELLKIEGML